MLETILTIIQTVGFPIACVVALGYFLFVIWTKQNETHNAREERLFQQMDKFSNTLENFNITLTRIDSRLERVEQTILEDEIEAKE